MTLILLKVNEKRVPGALSFRKSQARGDTHKGVVLLPWILLLLSSTPKLTCSLGQCGGLGFCIAKASSSRSREALKNKYPEIWKGFVVLAHLSFRIKLIFETGVAISKKA